MALLNKWEQRTWFSLILGATKIFFYDEVNSVMPIIFNPSFPLFTFKKLFITAPQHCVVYWVYWIENANYLNAAIFHQRTPRRGSDGKNCQKLCALTANEANERRKMKEAKENSVAKAGSSSASTTCSGALQRIPQLGESQGNTETWQKTTTHVTATDGTWTGPGHQSPSHGSKKLRNSQTVPENSAAVYVGVSMECCAG